MRHTNGCIIEHDPEDSECYTREDAEADEADRRYDEIKDGER